MGILSRRLSLPAGHARRAPGEAWRRHLVQPVLEDGDGQLRGLSALQPRHPGQPLLRQPVDLQRQALQHEPHASADGGRTWTKSAIVYPGGSGYSDTAFTRNGSIAVFFEKDTYNTAAFTVVPPSKLH